ncbi:MAG: TIGR03085 family metal-binding protein [Mycobacterium sp.]
MTVARDERAALVDTLTASGPDAPTLCAGWTTRDLVSHLLARERRLDALPGIVMPQFANWTHRLERNIAASMDWDALLAQLSSGPPLYSPFKWLDPVANVHELFVHHEDVRRAQADWTPRPLGRDYEAALRRLTSVLCRPVMAGIPGRVTLRNPDGGVVGRVGNGPAVTVTADPGELLQFVFGRSEIHATFDGDDDAVAAVKAAKRNV